MMQQMIITIKTPLISEAHEKLEEKLRAFFEKEQIEAVIDNLATGNSTVTNPKGERANLNVLYKKELKNGGVIEVQAKRG